MGNVEAKELISMTNGHELKMGDVGGRGCARWRGINGRGYDNCNSIINKVYLKTKPKNIFKN